jgi:hypothetical protein
MIPRTLLTLLIVSTTGMPKDTCHSAEEWKILESADTLVLSMNARNAGTFVQIVAVDEVAGVVRLVRRIEVGKSDNRQSAASGMDLTEERTYGLDGRILDARQKMAGTSGSTTWHLARDENDRWQLAITTGGQKRDIPVTGITENLLTTRALFQGIRRNTLKKGATFLDTVFELTSGKNMTSSIRCVETPSGKNGHTWRFTCRNSALDRDEAWHVDTLGNTVYQEMFPFTARKKTDTSDLTRDGSSFSLLSLIEALSVRVSRPALPEEAIRVTFEQELAPDTSVSSFYRKVNGAWLVTGITKACPGPEVSVKPVTGRDRFVSASVTMQADDARIRRLADSLCRKKTDRCDSIRACYSYVNNHLEKKYAPTFSNALETLKAGYGDCGEHSVLLGALLRAAGIPARVVLGLVYVTESKGYFYHAWVMAESRGRWVFVDAARGVFPATRDLVPLAIDDSGADILRIAKLIRKFKIDYAKRTHE